METGVIVTELHRSTTWIVIVNVWATHVPEFPTISKIYVLTLEVSPVMVYSPIVVDVSENMLSGTVVVVDVYRL